MHQFQTWKQWSLAFDLDQLIGVKSKKKNKTDFLVTTYLLKFDLMWLDQICQYLKNKFYEKTFCKRIFLRSKPKQKSMANEIFTHIHTKPWLESLIFKNIELFGWPYHKI